MPRRETREQLAVDLDQAAGVVVAALRVVMHVDYALCGVAGFLVARGRLGRVVLERAEDGADRHLHLRAGLHVLEDDHAALLEDAVDLVADAGVLDIVPTQTLDARSEVEIVLQIADLDACHFHSLHRLWRISALCLCGEDMPVGGDRQ